VTRALASQLVDDLPRALTGPSVDRSQTCCLGSESKFNVVIVGTCVFPRGIYVVSRDPRHAARWSLSPSKPIAPVAIERP
jgi:hypothetical protein